MRRRALTLEMIQAILNAHELHARRMKQIETHAWQEAQAEAELLARNLEEITGESQPIPANPFRSWKGLVSDYDQRVL